MGILGAQEPNAERIWSERINFDFVFLLVLLLNGFRGLLFGWAELASRDYFMCAFTPSPTANLSKWLRFDNTHNNKANDNKIFTTQRSALSLSRVAFERRSILILWSESEQNVISARFPRIFCAIVFRERSFRMCKFPFGTRVTSPSFRIFFINFEVRQTRLRRRKNEKPKSRTFWSDCSLARETISFNHNFIFLFLFESKWR